MELSNNIFGTVTGYTGLEMLSTGTAIRKHDHSISIQLQVKLERKVCQLESRLVCITITKRKCFEDFGIIEKN